MNLPNFINWDSFNELRHEMGAILTKNFIAQSLYKPIDLPIIDILRKNGIDIKIDDIQILKDRTLAYKGFRVLLYIRDVSHYSGKEDMPKFHLSFCTVLEKMRRNNRFPRYVVANRDDGFFQVNIIDGIVKPKIIKLNVCQSCLANISWDHFKMSIPRSDRIEIVNKFLLKIFFEKYPNDLISEKSNHTSDSAPINNYTSDWKDISERLKYARKYRCNKCGLQFTQKESKYIHVHHMNGMKNDNSDDNLMVLCIKCHANEPMHGHMKSLPDYLEFIKMHP